MFDSVVVRVDVVYVDVGLDPLRAYSVTLIQRGLEGFKSPPSHF
jgi:hypothetical protein